MSYICPVFKKGEKDDPVNYRGMTINSCLGKLFTKELNNRLDKFLEKREIFSSEQIGFSKGKRPLTRIILRPLSALSLDEGLNSPCDKNASAAL